VTGQAVTFSAEANLAPRVSADSKEIVWFQSDGSSKPSIRAMPMLQRPNNAGDVAKQSREVFADDALGAFALLPDGGLVLEQTATFRRDYTFQDLFWWDRASGKTTRLTTGARARDPAVSRDGRHIAFSQNGESSSTIAVMDFAAGAAITTAWRGARYDQAYQPSWSPDGTRIAFCGWQQGGMRDIMVLTLATGTVEHITYWHF
jgi:Tol biopolymer transport system component